jgi:hypothetical protein
MRVACPTALCGRHWVIPIRPYGNQSHWRMPSRVAALLQRARVRRSLHAASVTLPAAGRARRGGHLRSPLGNPGRKPSYLAARASPPALPQGGATAGARPRHGLCACPSGGALPCSGRPARAACVACRRDGSYLVDSASSHMLVSKIKPCMSKYKQIQSETANGSLYKLSFI